MSFTHNRPDEWLWQVGIIHYCVRYFEETDRLIWVSWVETDSGPKFDEGMTQSVESFLAGERVTCPPPEEVIAAVHEAMLKRHERKAGFFRRFWRK